MNGLKGFIGELKVRFTMFFLLGLGYKKLSNITIRMPDGNTTQIDHVVVSRQGIFIIETKNYKGVIRIDEYTGQWTQVFANSSYDFYSPIRQNDGHIGAMKYLLKNKDYPFINIVFFVGEATFENPDLPDGVAANLVSGIRLIKTYRSKPLKSSEVKAIVKMIEDRRMPNTWRTKFIHLMNIKRRNRRR